MKTDVPFGLAEVLFSNLKSMSEILSHLHENYPTTGGTDSDSQYSYETWSRVGVLDFPKGTYQAPSLPEIEESPDIVLMATLEEVCRLLFPTKDHTSEIDTVLRLEGKSCAFCIVGSVNAEKLGSLIEHLESKRRALLQT